MLKEGSRLSYWAESDFKADKSFINNIAGEPADQHEQEREARSGDGPQ